MSRILTPSAAVDAAINRARTLPALIANLRAVNPALATQLETKPLLASRSPWGTVLAYALGWVAARWGFGWDEDTTGLVAGLCVWLGSLGMRWLTKQPVAGILATPPGVPAADGVTRP